MRRLPITVITPRALFGSLFLFVVVALTVVACGGDDVELTLREIGRSPGTPIVIPAGEPLIIGVSTALTGPAGARGAEYRDAVVLAVERWKAANGPRIKGHAIQVHAEDDGCTDSGVTATAARRLMQRQGLIGVIGPQCSSGASLVIPAYAAAGVVAISGSATRTDLSVAQPDEGFFFRTAYRNDLEGALIGIFIADTLQAKNVYLVDDSGLYGQDLANSAQLIAELRGVTVSRRNVRRGDVDFSGLAREIAAANPEFVGFAGFNPEAGLFYRQLRDAGYQGPFGAADAAASQTGFIDPLGEQAEGVLFAGCRVAPPRSFVDGFVSLFGHPPGGATFTGHYADAATILLNAVRQAADRQPNGDLTIDPTRLRDAVRGTFLQGGITGDIAFDSNGDRVPEPGNDATELVQTALANQDTGVFTALGLVSCQVQDGKLVIVSGPDAPPLR